MTAELNYAIAKFKFSKDDFYAVEIIEQFDTYEQAVRVFSEKSYANLSGGTWQDCYNYEVIDVRKNVLHYHNGGIIHTIFD